MTHRHKPDNGPARAAVNAINSVSRVTGDVPFGPVRDQSKAAELSQTFAQTKARGLNNSTLNVPVTVGPSIHEQRPSGTRRGRG